MVTIDFSKRKDHLAISYARYTDVWIVYAINMKAGKVPSLSSASICVAFVGVFRELGAFQLDATPQLWTLTERAVLNEITQLPLCLQW